MAGDVSAGELSRARNLAETCADCQALAADLRLISEGLRKLPPVERPENLTFTIDGARARNLRRWGPWRQFFGLFAGNGSVLRPVAGAMMAFGLAGFLISSAPMLHFGAAGSASTAAETRDSRALATPATSFAVPGAFAPSTTGPAPSAGDGAFGGAIQADASPLPGTAGPADVYAGKQTNDPTVDRNEAFTAALLPWASAAFLVGGIGLLVLRRFAVRWR